MLTPEETHVIRQRALLAQQLEPSNGPAAILAATLAADVLLLLQELEAKQVLLGHLVHGSAERLHGSPAATTPAGDIA
jgi:hypothetical protein